MASPRWVIGRSLSQSVERDERQLGIDRSVPLRSRPCQRPVDEHGVAVDFDEMHDAAQVDVIDFNVDESVGFVEHRTDDS